MTIVNIIGLIITFINNVLVPFIFALAFIIFLYGVFKYFFQKGVSDPKARSEGAKFILWSVIAFAVMVSVWGLVNLVRGSVPLGNNNQPPLPGFNVNGTGTNNNDYKPVKVDDTSGDYKPVKTTPTSPIDPELNGLY